MNIQTIRKMQKELDLTEMQGMIDSGQVWKMEGSMGRLAMDLLRCGACMLPLKQYYDYYGYIVPSRKDVKPGTIGSYQNSVKYYSEI